MLTVTFINYNSTFITQAYSHFPTENSFSTATAGNKIMSTTTVIIDQLLEARHLDNAGKHVASFLIIGCLAHRAELALHLNTYSYHLTLYIINMSCK